MMTIKCISVILALAGAVTGLIAARYWFKSSKEPIQPPWPIEPADAQLSQMGWMAGMMEASTRVAKLNAIAACWTAVSVVFWAASTLLGSWADCVFW